MMAAILIAFILCALIHAQGYQVSESRICAHKYNNVEHNTGHEDDDSVENFGTAQIQGNITLEIEKCAKPTNFCYTLWESPARNGTGIHIMGQGCWEYSGQSDCRHSTCVATRPSAARTTARFCCCTGNLCNLNVSDSYVPPLDDSTKVISPDTRFLEQHKTIYESIVIVVLVGLVLVVAVVFYVYKTCGDTACKPEPDAVHLMENGISGNLHSDSYAVEHLKLSTILGQGHYGCVWKGVLHDREVAVKIFPSHYRQYFLNERDIYCLPFMDNPALLTYFGCDERVDVEGCVEYRLVLSYVPNGCLQDYLRSNVLDWNVFCKMALSVVKGLAHLHTDIRKGDKLKPCVSHRDMNTLNILVKVDLSCCLCDLGFAMKISGSKYFYNGEEQHAETKSINDVGTLRYMAPEVLEGAVNLRDCESSLKQIDVYALGLILWELASRCSDLYQPGAEIPPYSMPFEAEVGHHPTFEQMQVLVSRHKARPLFPEAWRDWAAVRQLRETIDDSWDQDAEARLTALCVEERLHELPVLWERQKGTAIYTSSVSPTVNPTFASLVQSQLRTNNNNNNNNNTGVHDRTFFNDSADDTGWSLGPNGKDTLESTVSEGTVETVLTLSPSETLQDICNKNSNQGGGGGFGATAPLQPYQGRNPCMERNLMPAAPRDGDIGALVDRSSKHASTRRPVTDHAPPTQDFPRPATPIPYVQNAVSTMPKQPNVPGNGSDVVAAPFRWANWGGLKKLLFGAHKDRGAALEKSNLLARKNEAPVIVETKVCLLPPDKLGGGVDANVGVVTSVVAEPKRRPSTLPLVGGDADSPSPGSAEHFQNIFCNKNDVNASRLKDPNCRVKTPGDVPPSVRRNRGKGGAARFSLYDDRMMAPRDCPAAPVTTGVEKRFSVGASDTSNF